MVNLILIRHAKTAWNEQRRIQGRSDIPLTENSIRLTREVKSQISNEKIDYAYVSPLLRTRQTAAVLLEDSTITIKIDDRLVERDFGEIEGKYYEQLGFINHELLFGCMDKIKNAESSQSLFNRARCFLDMLKKEHNNETLLIVSHGVFILYLIYAINHNEYKESDFKVEYIKNLKIYKYTYGDNK